MASDRNGQHDLVADQPHRDLLTCYQCTAPWLGSSRSTWLVYHRQDVEDFGVGAYLLEQRSWLGVWKLDTVQFRKS